MAGTYSRKEHEEVLYKHIQEQVNAGVRSVSIRTYDEEVLDSKSTVESYLEQDPSQMKHWASEQQATALTKRIEKEFPTYQRCLRGLDTIWSFAPAVVQT